MAQRDEETSIVEVKPSLRLSLGQMGLLVVFLLTLFELGFVGWLIKMSFDAETEIAREEESKKILAQESDLYQLLFHAIQNLNQYANTRDDKYYLAFMKESSDVQAAMRWLEKNIMPGNRSTLALVERQIKEGTDELVSLHGAIKEGSMADAMAVYTKVMPKFPKVIETVFPALDSLRSYERRLTDVEGPRIQKQARENQRRLLYGFVSLNILVNFLIGAIFLRYVTSRISRVVVNTERLAMNQELIPPLPGTDEIATLDKVFHAMADELREASRRERAVVENALDVICSLDADFKFQSVSAASYKVWQRDPDELIGRRLLYIVFPDDAAETLSALEQLRSGQTTDLSFENRVMRKDGTWVHTLWSAHWSKNEKAASIVAHDITERNQAESLLKASEERIRLILTEMPVGLIITDHNGVIEFVNKMTEEMFGYVQVALLGENLMKLLPPTKAMEAPAFMATVYPSCIGHIRELMGKKANQERFPVEFSLKEFQFADGPRLLSIVLDITERYEIQRMRQAFVAMVSHDLRTPLTTMRGFLSLLEAGALGAISDKALAAAEIQERSVDRLITLVNELLDMEKLESGTVQLEKLPFSLSAVIERSVEAVAGVAEQQKVQVEVPAEDL
ncbi:MAG TPA: PAS domain S-box protein, partial [Chroococcales cyanobacterium]